MGLLAFLKNPEVDLRERSIEIGAFPEYYMTKDRLNADEISVALDAFEEAGGGEAGREAFVKYLDLDADDWDFPEMFNRSEEWEPTAFVSEEDFDIEGDGPWETSYRYITHDARSWKEPYIPLIEAVSTSDYHGGAAYRSNYRVLDNMIREDETGLLGQYVIYSYGSHGTQAIFFRLDRGPLPQELADVVSALENYPILDESDWSELENEEEMEAWNNWAASNFLSELKKYATEEQEDYLDDLDDGELYELFRQGSESANVYVEHSDEGPYFPIERAAKEVDLDEYFGAEEDA